MKNFLFLLFICQISFAQTKDISKLSASQKKQELTETLAWIQSKTGRDFHYYHIIDKADRYIYLDFSKNDPTQVSITVYKYDNDLILSQYFFNLHDIFAVAEHPRPGELSVYTFDSQRFIKQYINNEIYNVDSVNLVYDNSVRFERMEKAWKYAIKLANGGKREIREKF